MPCSAYTCRLLHNDKVVALVALDKVNGHAHALIVSVPFVKLLGTVLLTGNAGANDHNRSTRVVLVAHRDLWPWLRTAHIVCVANQS